MCEPNIPHKAYTFFSHTACEYFPCHAVENIDTFNCLFCYCPLYLLGKTCGGNFSYTQEGVKDCSACTFPHEKANYEAVLERLQHATKAHP